MKILQNNIQSINTSLPLLRLTVQKLNIDIILLQEVWHPKEESINIRNYTQPIVKVRNGNEGGGVAIITRRNVKKVHLTEYDTDGLEAVWADVKVGNIRTVVGSVYIPPGDVNALHLLDDVIGKILQTYDHLIIGMDANSRNVLWDDNCIGLDQYKKSIQMGNIVEEMLHKHSLLIHNNGSPTYHSGSISTAPDITVSKGIIQYGHISWSTVEDDLRSPHDGIVIEVKSQTQEIKREVIDWRKFDWDSYKEQSLPILQGLLDDWRSNPSQGVDIMINGFTEKIHECVENLACKKTLSVHSKPWISSDISDQLKILRKSRKKYKLRRSPANAAEYRKLQERVTDMINNAEYEWWLRECEKLADVSEGEKWKMINRLTNQAASADIQPIKKVIDGNYVHLFEDDDIRTELGKLSH